MELDPSSLIPAIRSLSSAGTDRYKTAECRNIALGHAITGLGTMTAEVRNASEVTAFVSRQLHNPRPATRKKAVRFLEENGGRATPERPRRSPRP